jgi:hypothetical protein
MVSDSPELAAGKRTGTDHPGHCVRTTQAIGSPSGQVGRSSPALPVVCNAMVSPGMCRWAAITIMVCLVIHVPAMCLQENPKSPPQVTLQQMRTLVQRHLELIQAKKAEDLQRHFTPRLREHITAELLQEVQPRLAKAKVEELVAEIRQLEKNGRHLVIVRRNNGRLLTVFVWHHDQWLADTLWFR